jgi:hypothetical protein
MNGEQEFCEAVAEVLVARRDAEGVPEGEALPAGLQVMAKHATVALARPSLLAAPEDFVFRGNKILEGGLLLRLRSDGDAEPIETSQETLDKAGRYLLFAGRDALRAACQARGVWLRRLSLVAPASNEAGERGRAYEQRMKVWIQVEL